MKKIRVALVGALLTVLLLGAGANATPAKADYCPPNPPPPGVPPPAGCHY